MDSGSGCTPKPNAAKTTPSSHRDFFAKLYGSLEEEYNKKRELEAKESSTDNNAGILREGNHKSENNLFKRDTIECINEEEEDSEEDRVLRNEGRECDLSSSPELSQGSSPTKDEEISPPRIPPPTLKQLQKRFEVSIIYLYIRSGIK